MEPSAACSCRRPTGWLRRRDTPSCLFCRPSDGGHRRAGACALSWPDAVLEFADYLIQKPPLLGAHGLYPVVVRLEHGRRLVLAQVGFGIAAASQAAVSPGTSAASARPGWRAVPRVGCRSTLRSPPPCWSTVPFLLAPGMFLYLPFEGAPAVEIGFPVETC
jgi:hypothetical protein